jgi:hypothetical protein
MLRGPDKTLPSARAFALVAALAASALAVGCARVGQPGGGPADTTAPEVVSTEPADGAVGVPRDTTVRLHFSEDMDHVSVERAFSIEPEVELKNLRWDGEALVVRPSVGLPDSTTLTVRVAESATDHHGVALEAPFALMFSTGSSLDTGVIDGVVSMLGEDVPGAVVWACRRDVVTDGPAVRACRYATTTGPDGSFRISGVAASERPYTVLAFIDSDGDNVYTVGEETGRVAETAARIDTVGAAASGIRIELSDDLSDGLPGDLSDGLPDDLSDDIEGLAPAESGEEE